MVVLPLVPARRENMGHLLLELMFPVRNLGGMHPVGTGSFVDGFEPFDRVQGDPRFELSTITFSLCRHLLSPPPSHIDTAFYLNHLSSFRGTLYPDRKYVVENLRTGTEVSIIPPQLDEQLGIVGPTPFAPWDGIIRKYRPEEDT